VELVRAAFLEVSRAVDNVLLTRQRSMIAHQKNCPDWLARLVTQWELEGARVATFSYDQLVELSWLATTNLTPPRERSWDRYSAPLTPVTSRVGNAPPSIAFREVFSFSNFMARLVGGIQALRVRPAMSCMTKE